MSLADRIHAAASAIQANHPHSLAGLPQLIREIAVEVQALEQTAPMNALALGGCWFAALKGVVNVYPVRKLRDVVTYRRPEDADTLDTVLVLDRRHHPDGYNYLPAPAGAAEGEQWWAATIMSVERIAGIGRTPADAIVQFNNQMIGAKPVSWPKLTQAPAFVP